MGTVLIEICSARNLATKELERLTLGPFASVRWRDMQELASLLEELFVRKLHLEASSLEDGHGFRPDERNYWPVMAISIADNDTSRESVEQIVVTLAHMLSASGGKQMDLFDCELPLRREFEEAPEISRYLQKYGSRRISQPLNLLVDGVACARLVGRLAERPIDVIELGRKTYIGVVETISGPTREAEIRCPTEPKRTKVRFTDEFRFDLAMSIGSARPIHFQVEECLDAQGRKFLTVCKVESVTSESYELT